MNQSVDAFEVNFDGLVGPTHHYGGLALGNLASAASQQQVSNPREAALQGLKKMKALHDRGFKQGLLPPHERPAIPYLRSLGFSGSDQVVVAKAAKYHPGLLSQLSSASNMWVANAATVSPSADTADGRVHFTPANLNSSFHRSIEAPFTAKILGHIFADAAHFAHHEPLPAVSLFADEGAANHTRFCSAYGSAGVEFFVYGRSELTTNRLRPSKFPARQTLEASEAVARLHGLSSEQVIYAQQSTEAIDAGVFHNDVISVGNRHVLFYHEKAFVDSDKVVADIDSRLQNDFLPICVLNEQVALNDAVTSYLFNSQLLSLADGTMILVVPGECQEVPTVKQYLGELVCADNPINEVISFDLKQSMKNGGGPACLRLRVVLTEEELEAVTSGVLMTDTLYQTLQSWIEKHYRDRLTITDVQDPRFLLEVRTALDELSQILHMPDLYDFQ